MTAKHDAWERLDVPAVTPSARAQAPVADPAPRLRLRRSRGPVLAALDGGGDVFQRRMRDVLIGATVILVPAVALNVWVTIVGFDQLGATDSDLPGFLGNDTGGGIEDLAVWSAAVFASFLAAVVGHFASLILLGERFGNRASLGRALGLTGRRLPALFAAWILTHWWFPLMALIVVTAKPEHVGVWLFFFSLLCWVSAAATLLVVPAMVGEGLGPFAAAKRSWRLARLRFGVCVLFVLLATLLAGLLGLGIGTLVPLLEATGFISLGGATPIVQGVMLQLVVLIVVPLIALATAQVYVEIRIAGEGLDLVIEADSAFGSRSTEQPAP
ncbi:hypothetical protein [Ilumatobacter nonamiensis]|uniref:hypothetical protein n=1 Tax=Ilumatobacter nonamiensis TaxID=467093 RepID=UPI0011D27F15|nr:hypothetical protein [Ilumatobacter nonamiensis]